MSFLDKLADAWTIKKTLLCFGMDPVIERMHINTSGDLADEIVTYFSKILHGISPKISAVKPNVAFYLQYGSKGYSALVRLIQQAHSMGLPVIIDAKIGDIGRTSKAYAGYVFEELKGDAVTLNPYMGYDSLEPFFAFEDRGYYVLALTSNEGARNFQYADLAAGMPLFEYIIQELCTWSKNHPSLGAVIGATHAEFQSCVRNIVNRKCSIPLLVPGVGAQGGSYGKIKSILEESYYDSAIVRINVSSSISYAHERFPGSSIEEAAYLVVEDIVQS